MKRLAASLGLLLTISMTVEAQADIPDAVFKAGQSEAFAGRRAILIYALEDSGGVWTMVSIFSQPYGRSVTLDPAAPRRWVARRQTGHNEQFAEETRWADSDTCPHLIEALWSLTQIQTPPFEVPGLSPDTAAAGPAPMATDRPVITLWGTARPVGGAPISLRASSLGGEMDAWGRATETGLADCWSDQAPSRHVD